MKRIISTILASIVILLLIVGTTFVTIGLGSDFHMALSGIVMFGVAFLIMITVHVLESKNKQNDKIR